jgi:superfamily I DNA/RNA helicase
MMDVVNYILSQMRFRGYSGPSIHYLMIDEVQDLPHATLYMLAKIAQQGVFFSGDTAQTIAKGIGFRFGDLKSMFGQKHFDTELKLARPTVMQLTINFRSHNNILQLANSVISIIEILFPATIDRLKK